MLSILLWFYLCFKHNLAAFGCTIGFNKNSRASDPRLLSGYNDVLGPIINLTYFDTSLILSAKKLYPGSLRHPGGTVANYWSFRNASYIQPCNTSYYNYCKQQAIVQKQPPQTFSAANFLYGIGSAALLSEDNAHSIVYDLNLLTLNGNTLLDELDVLENEVGISNVNYLELGNEYYKHKHYGWEFPNSTVYMKKALPLIQQARIQFPDAKIAAVAQTTLAGFDSTWNDGIAKYSGVIDAVTFHDYSLTKSMIENLTSSEQRSFISIYGLSVIPKYTLYVKDTFRNGKTLWMTEYNLGILDSSISFSVLHAMYGLSYIIASVCDSQNIMEFLMFSNYSTQQGNGYDSVSFNPLKSNDIDHASFNVVGQIFAQLSYVGMVSNNNMHCLTINPGVNATCPTVKVEVVGEKGLNCVNGIGFTTSSTPRFGFVLSNSCDDYINIGLNLTTIIGNVIQEIDLKVWNYVYWQNGNSGNFTKCKNNNVWDDVCAAVKTNVTRLTIHAGTKVINMIIDPLSVIIANVPFN